MDARSVMEQRLQAMVCCFSMVQRVLARQPDTTCSIRHSNTNTTSSTSSSVQLSNGRASDVSHDNTSSASGCNSNDKISGSIATGSATGSDGLLPTRTVTGVEASERIWRFLSAVPTLMEVIIIKINIVILILTLTLIAINVVDYHYCYYYFCYYYYYH